VTLGEAIDGEETRGLATRASADRAKQRKIPATHDTVVLRLVLWNILAEKLAGPSGRICSAGRPITCEDSRLPVIALERCQAASGKGHTRFSPVGNPERRGGRANSASRFQKRRNLRFRPIITDLDSLRKMSGIPKELKLIVAVAGIFGSFSYFAVLQEDLFKKTYAVRHLASRLPPRNVHETCFGEGQPHPQLFCDPLTDGDPGRLRAPGREIQVDLLHDGRRARHQRPRRPDVYHGKESKLQCGRHPRLTMV